MKKARVDTPRKNVVRIETKNFQRVFVKSISTDFNVEKKMAEIHSDGKGANTSAKNDSDGESDNLESVLAALEGKEQFVIENKDEEPKISDERRKTKKKIKWEIPKARRSEDEEPSAGIGLRSDIGEFPAKVIKSVYNNTFCLADKYLFEFGLTKQGVR